MIEQESASPQKGYMKLEALVTRSSRKKNLLTRHTTINEPRNGEPFNPSLY